jgi:hypothetical protein
MATTAVVLAVAFAVRLVFILATPPDVYSADMSAWQVVVAVLAKGYNPYQFTKYLSWPPFWMQILFFLGKLAAIFNISLFQMVRAFLLFCEALAVFLTALLLTRALPSSNHRALLIIGFALNPVAIFSICQHCNFDVLVSIFVLLFVLSQVDFQTTGSVASWLASCLCLGLGILTKTVPLILTPLLLVGLRRVSWRDRLLGLCLLAGPAALALSVLYALAPAAVESNVLAYRSFPGWFGITGLLDVANLQSVAVFYTRASSWLFALGLCLLSFLLVRRQRLLPSEVVLLATLLLMAVVIFGPGYGPQYVFWYLPLLVASWAFWGGRWHRTLLILAAVGAITYTEEYGLLQSLGMLFLRMGLADSWIQRSKDFGTPAAQSLFRLPLFVAYLLVFFTGVNALRQSLRRHEERASEERPPAVLV